MDNGLSNVEFWVEISLIIGNIFDYLAGFSRLCKVLSVDGANGLTGYGLPYFLEADGLPPEEG